MSSSSRHLQRKQDVVATRRHSLIRPRVGPLLAALEEETAAAPAAASAPEVTVADTAEATFPPPRQVKYGESTKRSLAKAFGWRITAAIITLITGLIFAKDLSMAATIVGSDFVTKSGFMFLGERVWNKVKWGQGTGGDSNKRSLYKALLWRVFAAANTLACSAFLSGDFSVARKIAGTDTIVKTALFYVNERIWNAIEWGKEYELEYNI